MLWIWLSLRLPRISSGSHSLGLEIGKTENLGHKRCENIFIAGLLHDIGALSVEEKKAVHDIDTYAFRRHCIRGERLFQLNPWLERAAPLVRNHHLAWSRADKPRDAPAAVDAQILHLADDLERHIDRGVYILNQVERLLDRLRALSGREFNPDVRDCSPNKTRSRPGVKYMTDRISKPGLDRRTTS